MKFWRKFTKCNQIWRRNQIVLAIGKKPSGHQFNSITQYKKTTTLCNNTGEIVDNRVLVIQIGENVDVKRMEWRRDTPEVPTSKRDEMIGQL